MAFCVIIFVAHYVRRTRKRRWMAVQVVLTVAKYASYYHSTIKATVTNVEETKKDAVLSQELSHSCCCRSCLVVCLYFITACKFLSLSLAMDIPSVGR